MQEEQDSAAKKLQAAVLEERENAARAMQAQTEVRRDSACRLHRVGPAFFSDVVAPTLTQTFTTQLAAALKEAQLGFKSALDAVRVREPRCPAYTSPSFSRLASRPCPAPVAHAQPMAILGRGAGGGKAADGRSTRGAGGTAERVA